jgi:hypothetical protein
MFRGRSVWVKMSLERSVGGCSVKVPTISFISMQSVLALTRSATKCPKREILGHFGLDSKALRMFSMLCIFFRDIFTMTSVIKTKSLYGVRYV